MVLNSVAKPLKYKQAVIYVKVNDSLYAQLLFPKTFLEVMKNLKLFFVVKMRFSNSRWNSRWLEAQRKCFKNYVDDKRDKSLKIK